MLVKNWIEKKCFKLISGLMDSLSLNLIQLHSEVHEVDTTDAFRAAILDGYKDLFEGELGKYTRCLQNEA